jgi:outer membrane immunogenic protein
MQKTLAVATVAAIVGFAGAANAADVYSRGGLKDGPAYVAETSWTGFHVGLGVGAEAVNHELSARYFDFDGVSSTGVVGTVEVGYDRQFGNIVAGVFFNYDFGDNVSTDLTLGPITAALKQTDSWTAGGRLGYLVNPSTLAYALAGYTESTFELSVLGQSADETLSGWTVGGGLETKLGGNWTLKGEYRFTEFDTLSLGRSLDLDTSVQSGRLVLSYKFGGEDVIPLK